ncbi:MAG: hypothetical protein AB1689_01010 [Thermodesulfobacteriota bacterium]
MIRVAAVATWAVVALHGALLAAALGDYRVSVDSAYHVALARRYGEQGAYFWDDVHYAPAHRPNLQGPAVHVAVGALGRILGGTGDDYVVANALVALAGWLAAVLTLGHFARREGRDRAALLAVAAFTGSAFASGSFSVNIPSGWLFVVTPWAVDAFLRGRTALAAGLTALACYTHLGGFLTAPLGLAVAALLTGRWRALARVGIAVALLTAPYWVHFLRGLPWYVGRKGDTAWMIDPLPGLLWVGGVAWALRAPRERAFLVAWALAPLAWLVQDASRFVLQSSLAGTALGGVALARWMERWPRARVRTAATVAFVALATVFPLGPPALGAEVIWLLARFPRMLDWQELHADAGVLPDDVERGRLVHGYAVYVVSGLAAFRDLEGERGHWVEVQPRPDPAEEIPVGDKVYVLALPPDDEHLRALERRGWLAVHGGGAWSAVVTFEARPSLEEARRELGTTLARDAAWIAERCEHNAMGDIVALVASPDALARRRAVRGECRRRVARVHTALLAYCGALEPSDPARARLCRTGARAVGWMCALVGDEATLDFRTAATHERMRGDMRAIAATAAAGGDPEPAFAAMLERYVEETRGGLLASRRELVPQLAPSPASVSSPASTAAATP